MITLNDYLYSGCLLYTSVIGGLAIDIGTTTVSAVLINMENGEILSKSSAGNGQIRFGADAVSYTHLPGFFQKHPECLPDAVRYSILL